MTPMLCLTEIKLSIINRHTQLYGGLGFGFTRSFVLEIHGTPVKYVDGTDKDIFSYHTV
ncbi:TPA: hypothetical protein ENS27_05880 [bacterium]|nr:hypothetical protein [bacterium]